MLSAFLYFLAMSFTIPVLPKVVNEMLTGSKAVRVCWLTSYKSPTRTTLVFLGYMGLKGPHISSEKQQKTKKQNRNRLGGGYKSPTRTAKLALM